MKKLLVFLMLLLGSLFPFACSDNNSNKGAGPTLPSGGGGGNTSTPTPPFVSAPGTPTPSPTFAIAAPAYVSQWGTSSAPNAIYLSGGQLYVAENDNVLAMMEVFNPATGALNQGANYMVVGGPATVLLAGPQGVAFSPVGGGIFCLLDNASGASTIYVGSSGGFPDGPITQSFWGNENFKSPKGMTADANGNIYVADTGNAYVEQFLALGSPGSFWLHRWNGYNTGSGASVTFVQPYAVACDAAGNVYVGDAGYRPSQVEKFSPAGETFLGAFPTLPNCVIHGLTVDAAGNVYVADFGNNLVEEYNNSGSLLRYWGIAQGPKEDHPFGPSCIAIDTVNNHILVGDSSNENIIVFGP